MFHQILLPESLTQKKMGHVGHLVIQAVTFEDPPELPGHVIFDFDVLFGLILSGNNHFFTRCPLGPKTTTMWMTKKRRNNHQHVGRKAFAQVKKKSLKQVLCTSKLGTRILG